MLVRAGGQGLKNHHNLEAVALLPSFPIYFNRVFGEGVTLWHSLGVWLLGNEASPLGGCLAWGVESLCLRSIKLNSTRDGLFQHKILLKEVGWTELLCPTLSLGGKSWTMMMVVGLFGPAGVGSLVFLSSDTVVSSNQRAYFVWTGVWCLSFLSTPSHAGPLYIFSLHLCNKSPVGPGSPFFVPSYQVVMGGLFAVCGLWLAWRWQAPHLRLVEQQTRLVQ